MTKNPQATLPGGISNGETTGWIRQGGVGTIGGNSFGLTNGGGSGGGRGASPERPMGGIGFISAPQHGLK